MQHCTKLEAALKGTEMQLVAVSDQLAQRAILYESQERRWKSSLSGQTALSSERNNELVDIRARFEQLQQQYFQMDSDRMEAVLENREIRATLTVLETERVEERIRLEKAEEELSTAVHFSHELQQQLDRLKGADLTALEQSMAAENEIIRDQAGDREHELMRQLELGRESLLEEKQHREELTDEMQSLHQKNRYLSDLLQQLRHKIQDDPNSSNRSLISFENISDVGDADEDNSLTHSSAVGRVYAHHFQSDENPSSFDGVAHPMPARDHEDVVNFTGSGGSVRTSQSTLGTADRRNPFAMDSGHVTGLNESFLTGRFGIHSHVPSRIDVLLIIIRRRVTGGTSPHRW